MSRIFYKILATGLLVVNTLIKYNKNWEENDGEEKEPIGIELTEQKAYPEMIQALLTLNDKVFKKKTKKINFG